MLSTLKRLQFLRMLHTLSIFPRNSNYDGLLFHAKVWFLLDILLQYDNRSISVYITNQLHRIQKHAQNWIYLCVSNCESLTRRQVLNKVDIPGMKYTTTFQHSHHFVHLFSISINDDNAYLFQFNVLYHVHLNVNISMKSGFPKHFLPISVKRMSNSNDRIETMRGLTKVKLSSIID